MCEIWGLVRGDGDGTTGVYIYEVTRDVYVMTEYVILCNTYYIVQYGYTRSDDDNVRGIGKLRLGDILRWTSRLT